MSKKNSNNPYLKAHEKATKQLTQLQSDLNILEAQKNKYNTDTYNFKKDKITNSWNKQLGYMSSNGQPTRDLNFILQDLEKQIAENTTALGSRYMLIPGTNFMSTFGQGFGVGNISGATTYGRNNLLVQPKFSKVSGRDYIINPHYIDRFNPEGTAAQDLKIQNDEYGRNKENPNFGINPNKLESLKIENGE